MICFFCFLPPVRGDKHNLYRSSTSEDREDLGVQRLVELT